MGKQKLFEQFYFNQTILNKSVDGIDCKINVFLFLT